MNFLNLFTEDQIPEVESEFSKVINSGIKEPVKVVNTVLSNTLNSNIFMAVAIEENRPAALDYIKTLLNIPEKKEVTAPGAPTTIKIEIDPEFKTLITEPRPEEIAQLEENIIQEGCRDPLVIWGNILLDGHNRFEICQRNSLPFKTVQAAVRDRDEAKAWLIKNQLGKRNLNEYQRSTLALQLEAYFKEKAKQNQAAAGGDRRSEEYIKNSQPPDSLNEKPLNLISDEAITPINVNKELAAIAGVSKDYIAKVKKIEKEAPPELKEQVRKGNITVNKACSKIKQVHNYQKKKEVNLREYASGKYDVIYCDAPWRYSNSEVRGSAEDQYPTMTVQEICSMPVKDFTTTNAVLFFWTTNAHLPEALEVIKAWDFQYTTNFVRIKNNSFGCLNHYGKHELLIVAKKGSHMRPEFLTNSVIYDPEGFTPEHSQKPDLYYDLIEKEYPGRRYLELFARAQRPGWEVFSNEPELRAA